MILESGFCILEFVFWIVDYRFVIFDFWISFEVSIELVLEHFEIKSNSSWDKSRYNLKSSPGRIRLVDKIQIKLVQGWTVVESVHSRINDDRIRFKTNGLGIKSRMNQIYPKSNWNRIKIVLRRIDLKFKSSSNKLIAIQPQICVGTHSIRCHFVRVRTLDEWKPN